ncbi:MAG: ATP-dependent DNA helicase RecG [Spirochaetales bacterium]|jgi:ATP-dependent DNA helicase RecG|nr:ATP-dependent DNA helicase RecG [Spirochaetales bacterium]
MYLRELTQKPREISGVGPANARLLSLLGIETVAGLLEYFPRDYQDRQKPVTLAEAIRGGREGAAVWANTVIWVDDLQFLGFGKKRTPKFRVHDSSAAGALMGFNRPFLAQTLKPGRPYRLWGSFKYRYGEFQSTDFEVEPCPPSGETGETGSGGEESRGGFGRILPVYRLTRDLRLKSLRSFIADALRTYGRHIEDELPAPLIKRRGLLPLNRALQEIHFPGDFSACGEAARTLKYRELFFLQLGVARRGAARQRERRGPPADRGRENPAEWEGFLRRLPFSLTPDQEKVLEEIRRDMDSGFPMSRLLQGDVGAGKTLMAFMACLLAAARGGQTAFMAPTEILARQHGDNASRLLEPLGIRPAFLGGGLRARSREELLRALKAGEIDLLIGTHALFTPEVEFANLRLIIVDEQQRFGVAQRSALQNKAGFPPDVLLMTATPIPRTLALTVFGDLDISVIRTLPEGRRPILTHTVQEAHLDRVYRAVRRELERGRQAYFVYPAIGESEKTRLNSAIANCTELTCRVFPDFPVTLVHSRLKEEEKRERMEGFVKGRFKVLVATSVVEVGVDVAQATCMVITNAERFGLSALHQLRGRVGRSQLQSYCFLVFGGDLTEDAKDRLKIMRETTDGFKIAEEDLRIRGPGDLAGTLQSGYLELKIADIARDAGILEEAREDALALAREDMELNREENRGLKEFLASGPAAAVIP